MHAGRRRVVRQVERWLRNGLSLGTEEPALASDIAELEARVRRLHRLGEAYTAVSVSGYVRRLKARIARGSRRGDGVATDR